MGLDDLGIVDDDAGASAVDPATIADASAPAGGAAIETPEARLIEILEAIPLFTGLLPTHLHRMASRAHVVGWKKNEYVFKHGDPGDGLYIVNSGAVRISRDASGMGEEALAIVRDGGHFGEMSLIDDVPRSADAIVHEDATLLKLGKDDMRDLLFVDRELAYELLWRFVRTLSGRLRESNDRLMMLTATSRF
jgi:CRP-like cAMP-binding protein